MIVFTASVEGNVLDNLATVIMSYDYLPRKFIF